MRLHGRVNKKLLLLFCSDFFLNPRIRICFIDLRERETNINQLHPLRALTRDWTHNLGVSPGRGSNLQASGIRRRRSNPLSHPAGAKFNEVLNQVCLICDEKSYKDKNTLNLDKSKFPIFYFLQVKL